MTDVQAAFQKSILEAIEADDAVSGLVDGVYDNVQPNAFKERAAYISFGPSDVTEIGMDCIVIGQHSLQIDVWSRSGGYAGCKKIVDALKALLHLAEMEVSGTIAIVEVGMRRVLPDPDGITRHGVVIVTARITEAEIG